MDVHESLNLLLVKLFRRINALEEREICKDEFQNVTLNEIHVIEAIGADSRKNMSTVAKSLEITTGTLTISVNSLVKKGLVERVRSEEDRRVVLISLTELGRKAYDLHEQFHEKMISEIIDKLSDQEIEVFNDSLNKLNDFFEGL